MSEAGAQERISGYWNRYAHAYDTHQRDRQAEPGVAETWSRVWRSALPPAPAAVLDVGTGSGNVALLLAHLGYRVTGIDLAEQMLAEAQGKANGDNPPTFALADAADPPFEPSEFDAITARYSLWTLRDPVTALERWARLLKPGGVVVAVDSPWFPEGIGEGETQREQDFRAAYSPDVVARLPLAEAADIHQTALVLKQAGFVDVAVEELPEIYDIDSRYGVAPGHKPQMQYVIKARVDKG